MFNFIKEKIKKIYTTFTTKAASLFSRTIIDEEFLRELEVLLLGADVGVATTRQIMAHVRDQIKQQKISSGDDIKRVLEEQLLAILSAHQSHNTSPRVLLMVGINGSGKTTTCAKLAQKLVSEQKKVLLVAADTFRAAATEQLVSWGEKIGVRVLVGKPDQDPASLVFDACDICEKEGYDHLIIDTAGRLQTKVNLMRELEKVRRIISKKLPNENINTWLSIDAMLGQNSFEQAKLFHEATNLDGIILTKLDGTGKGGIVFAITKELSLPIVYVTFGEALDDIKQFDPTNYVHELLEA